MARGNRRSVDAGDEQNPLVFAGAGQSPPGQGHIPPGFRVPTVPEGGTPTPDMFPNTFSGQAYHGTTGKAGQFVPINPNDVERLATGYDTREYNLSDQLWKSRFPQLSEGRDYAVNDAYGDITGQPNQFVEGATSRAGLGDVNVGTDFQRARALGTGITDIANRNRNYFMTLLRDNPQRNFGLNHKDIYNIGIANTGAANKEAAARAQSQLNAYEASVNQGIQNEAALIGGVGKLGSAAISNPAIDPFLTPSYSGYGNTALQDYNLATNQFGEGNVNYNAAGEPIDATTGAGLSDSGGI